MNDARRAWSFKAFGLVLLAVGAAVLLALVLWVRADGGVSSTDVREDPEVVRDGIDLSADLSPRIVLFGDTLVARVDALVDPSRVDPESVRVSWAPAPWALAGAPRTVVERAGPRAAHVRTTYVLRCLAAVCAPARETERVDLKAARVTYTVGDRGARSSQSRDVSWPTLVVHTRVGDLDAASRDALAAPWRADLTTLPAVTYRVSPWLLGSLLVVLGVALLVIAGIMIYRIWPVREPEPEPEPEPEHVASVLEQALELLEAEVSADGVEERRRALELVADEVEQLGEAELAGSARELAWSPVDPAPERTRELAADLRVRFADVLEELEAERSNGADPVRRVNGGHP